MKRSINFTLRKFKESDVLSLVTYANNYNIAKFLTNQFPHPYSEEDGKAFLSMAVNDPGVFAIDVDGEAIGSIGIFPQSDIHEKNAELGYWLAEPFWGKGIMTQAVQELAEYGFKTFDITRIFARPFSTNPASQRVLEKAGFTFEAQLKKALYKDGEYMDEMIYAIRNDFKTDKERIFCQSCGMPLDKEDITGTDSDGTKNSDYCIYCYKDGAFTADVTMEEMIGISLAHMKEIFRDDPNFNEQETSDEMNAFFPKLKRWAEQYSGN